MEKFPEASRDIYIGPGEAARAPPPPLASNGTARARVRHEPTPRDPAPAGKIAQPAGANTGHPGGHTLPRFSTLEGTAKHTSPTKATPNPKQNRGNIQTLNLIPA